MDSIDDPATEPPKWLERSVCIAIGVIAGGAGGYTVFERSNQIGSTALLVISTLFLVIGIQGTRLMRFTSGSNGVVLEQKKRLAKAIDKAADEGNIEKVSGIAEGAAIASNKRTSWAGGGAAVLYERQVASVIAYLGYQTIFTGFDSGYDLIIGDGNNHIIRAEVKRLVRDVSAETVAKIAAMSVRSVGPYLLITYSQLSAPARSFAEERAPDLEIVQWRGEQDNDRLAETLSRMFASMPVITADGKASNTPV
jgi:hypothetical protein